MKCSLPVGLVIALCCAALPAPQRAQAAGPIQACRASDGTSVYTDKPCRAFGARSVPVRDELATRIVREQALEAQITGVQPDAFETFAPASLDEGTMAAARDAIGRRAVAGGCARTPTQLAMDLRGALGLGDVNRVAESYDWVGMSNRQGQRTLDRLQQLIGRPVVDSHYFDAQITSSPFIADAGASMTADAFDDRPGDAGMLQLTLGNGTQATIIDFDVRHYAGCYFVRY